MSLTGRSQYGCGCPSLAAVQGSVVHRNICPRGSSYGTVVDLGLKYYMWYGSWALVP